MYIYGKEIKERIHNKLLEELTDWSKRFFEFIEGISSVISLENHAAQEFPIGIVKWIFEWIPKE